MDNYTRTSCKLSSMYDYICYHQNVLSNNKLIPSRFLRNNDIFSCICSFYQIYVYVSSNMIIIT
eukprot:UN03903